MDLVAAGAIRVFRHTRNQVWGLTNEGRRQLTQARQKRRVPQLPEAPQHQAWRLARELAGDRIAPVRLALRDALAETELLPKNKDSVAEVWFAQANSLKMLCAELGWATHCLEEWAEPDDARLDSDAGERRRRLEIISLQNRNLSVLS